MGLAPDGIEVEKWGLEKSKGRKKKDKEVVKETGCWSIRFSYMMGNCISSKSKGDTSISGISTSYANNNTSNGQPVAPVASSTTTTSSIESNPSTPKLSEELKIASQLRKFAFSELKSATRNFRPESLLGEGGFGCVFKGWIEENGTAPMKPGTGLTVAVKTLNHDGLQGHREWLAEVNFLGDLLHPNLVKLIGYCIEDDQRLLVYEFMPRGSLENHLFRKGSLPLPWSIRMKVALGAAKGLAFLHEEAERPVIYRDFKTSNILLDADYKAKLSDFGLAKDGPEGDKTHVSTRVMGTYGYAAPEYVMTGHLTSRSDVYSFGVVLLEMLTGRRSMDKSRPNGEHNLVEWARPHLGERRRFYRLIDPRLEGQFSIKGAQKAAQLAAHCLSRDPKSRPLMSEVVEILKPLLNLKDMASSSYYYQTMQVERTGSNLSVTGKNGGRTQIGGSVSRKGQPMRSLTIPNGSHASPYYYQHHPSPKVNDKHLPSPKHDYKLHLVSKQDHKHQPSLKEDPKQLTLPKKDDNQDLLSKKEDEQNSWAERITEQSLPNQKSDEQKAWPEKDDKPSTMENAEQKALPQKDDRQNQLPKKDELSTEEEDKQKSKKEGEQNSSSKEDVVQNPSPEKDDQQPSPSKDEEQLPLPQIDDEQNQLPEKDEQIQITDTK